MKIYLNPHFIEDTAPHVFAEEYPSLDAARRTVEEEGFQIVDVNFSSTVSKIVHFHLTRATQRYTTLDIPILADLDARILEQIGRPGCVLNMYEWHGSRAERCGTTHCRGGWAIFLAGERGRLLEEHYGSELTAMLLYEAAYPKLPIPNFFALEEEAMEDMEARAQMPPTSGHYA